MLRKATEMHATSAGSVIGPQLHRGIREKFSTKITDRIAIRGLLPSKANHSGTSSPIFPRAGSTRLLFSDVGKTASISLVASLGCVEKLANLKMIIHAVLIIAFSCQEPRTGFLIIIASRSSVRGFCAAIFVFLFPTFRLSAATTAVRAFTSSSGVSSSRISRTSATFGTL